MDTRPSKIKEAVDRILSVCTQPIPEIAIVFGTGLSMENLTDFTTIPYTDIPHFPKATVPGHAGKVLIGFFENKPVVILSGRFHYYEGYSMSEVVFPIRVLKGLGIKKIKNIGTGDFIRFNLYNFFPFANS